MENYIGKTLNGRYDIREVVGVGGMAIVYKAYDKTDERVVAIKVLKEEFLANEEFRRRFKNESNAIAILSHPNIVKVFDFYFSDRLQYIVMEFIEGITLKEYIEQQRVVSWKETLHFITQILRALQHAHDKGVVHRDIKPQNIMVLQNGNIKVTDFGIARFSRGETRTLAETGAIGSVHYISPEQARGEMTDNKTDIYSVGVVLYEMLTGQLPFQSDSAVSVALMQVQAEARKPRDINPNIPVGLEQITLRAMQKNKFDRYQTAAEMLLDLDEFKRNPMIKFNYSYYSDPQPINYVPPMPPTPVRSDFDEFRDEEFEEREDTQAKQRTVALPVLAGVLVVFIAVLIAGGVYLYNNVFNKDKITIPQFVNLKYEDVISQYSDEFVFESPPAYEYNSGIEDGLIIKQSHKVGEKVKVGTVIRLTVAASSGDQVKIPDEVLNKQASKAKEILIALGFNPVVQPDPNYDENKQEGIVTGTNPAVGEKANRGSVVVIYENRKSSDEVSVPKLVGDSEEDAKEKILYSNLKVGKIESVPSPAAQKGFVVSQSPEEGEMVAKDTEINLFIGSGEPAVSTKKITIVLPTHTGVTANIQTYLNDKLVSANDVLLDGSSYEVSFDGSGEEDTFLIKIDGSDYIEGTIDFTTDPPTEKILKSTPYVKKASIPDVRGRNLNSAKKILEDAGFKNYTVKYEKTDEYSPGIVIDQKPNTSDKYEYSQEITLYVSEATTSTTTTSSHGGDQ